MRTFLVTLLVFACSTGICQKDVRKIITTESIKPIIETLASDEMNGRKASSPKDIDKAAAFISRQFGNAGLKYYGDLSSFIQVFTPDPFEPTRTMSNVVGIIPGKSRADEFVIFSAHYDHIGVIHGKTDSIANGADDDASGTTAVIALAKYFAQTGGAERTLIFVTFTGEEEGGFGSQHFSRTIDPAKVVAMFNIEMIGKPSKWGTSSAFITGFELTDFGRILQQNADTIDYTFYPDPYPEENLFFRSDNERLASLGVPAHTISTVQIDVDLYYHTVHDEVETLDLVAMTDTIRAIAVASTGIVNGTQTPSRIPTDGVR